MPTTVTTGTLMVSPGGAVLFTGTAALGTEETVIIPDPVPPQPTTLVFGGGYRPTNWPSGGKPFRF